MSDKTAKEAPRRTLTSLQSTGRIGRSTLKQGLMSWFSYAGIEFNAIDADPEHHTLSSWYPDLTDKKPYREEQDLLPILNAVGEAPVQLIDFPSQETQSLLRAFEHFNAFKLFEAKNTRPTVFIFASDERAAMLSAHQIISSFDSHADYVIVDNPARFTSRVFYHSKLPEILEKFKAPTILIPRITAGTMEILDDASKRTKKALTFREAEPVLEIGSQFELEHWRNRLFAQFEEIVHFLLPSPELIQQKVDRPKQKKLAAALDPYDL
jgi:hypothetical protein